MVLPDQNFGLFSDNQNYGLFSETKIMVLFLHPKIWDIAYLKYSPKHCQGMTTPLDSESAECIGGP